MLNKTLTQTLFTLVFLVILSSFAHADDVVGVWKTIDDKSNEARSLIQLSIEDDKLVGKIIKIFPQPGQAENPTCEMCTGELKNAPILGLQIVNGLSLVNGKWEDGSILDPDNGKNYKCKIWLEGDVLKVRGYIGFFYRTQQWLRYQSTGSSQH